MRDIEGIGVDDAVKRSFRGIVFFDNFRTSTDFIDKLDGRDKEVEVYPVSKILQCCLLEKRGIIPRHSGIEKILSIAKLMKRGISAPFVLIKVI